MLLFVVSGTFTACATGGEETVISDEMSSSQESNNMADPSKITNSRSEIEFVRKRFERIQKMDAEQRLECETVEYLCEGDGGKGSFHFCKLGGELVRATHEFTEGDHGGGTEVYYYDGDELYFTVLTASSWKFGTPPPTEGAGEPESGTVDHVQEERRYYFGGNLIERLFKDYTVKSWERPTPPENIASARNGKEIDNGIGATAVLGVEKAMTYNCG